MIDKNRYQIWSASLSFPAASPKKKEQLLFHLFPCAMDNEPRVFFIYLNLEPKIGATPAYVVGASMRPIRARPQRPTARTRPIPFERGRPRHLDMLINEECAKKRVGTHSVGRPVRKCWF